MSNDADQMKILRDKAISVISDIDEIRSAIRALASYGREALPYLAEIVQRPTDGNVVNIAEFYTSRINNGFRF
jgi:hypothetical protein